MFVKLSVNFICFAWLVHCSLLHSIGAHHHHHPFAVFFCCFIGVLYWCLSCFCCCSLCFIAHQHSFLRFVVFVMLCWWPSLPLWYVLLVVINVSHSTCWCSLLFSCRVLLVLIIVLVLCFVGAHRHPLLHFVDVCHGPLIVFKWCLSSALCYTTLVFDNGPLCFIDACCGPLIVFY